MDIGPWTAWTRNPFLLRARWTRARVKPRGVLRAASRDDAPRRSLADTALLVIVTGIGAAVVAALLAILVLLFSDGNVTLTPPEVTMLTRGHIGGGLVRTCIDVLLTILVIYWVRARACRTLARLQNCPL